MGEVVVMREKKCVCVRASVCARECVAKGGGGGVRRCALQDTWQARDQPAH